jgi:hypothetical protein
MLAPTAHTTLNTHARLLGGRSPTEANVERCGRRVAVHGDKPVAPTLGNLSQHGRTTSLGVFCAWWRFARGNGGAGLLICRLCVLIMETL